MELPEGWTISTEAWGHVLKNPDGDVHGVYQEKTDAISEARLAANLPDE